MVACKPAAPQAESRPAPAPVAASAPTGELPTTTPDPVATAPSAATAGESQASFIGYGDMKLGSTVEEAKVAWAGELNGKPMQGSSCYYLSPKWVKVPSDFAFMIEEGRFVRYDVGTDKQAAPGGGKVGMGTDELQKLYNHALESAPHKYVQGGHTLSVAARGVAPSKLVFEADAAGKISAWRVGLPPQVDYVEGCS